MNELMKMKLIVAVMIINGCRKIESFSIIRLMSPYAARQIFKMKI